MKATIIAQYHPAAALHQPRLWSTMIDDWQNLPEKVDADYTVTKPYKGAHYGNLIALDTENAPDGSLGQWSIALRDLDGHLKVSPFYGRQDWVDYQACQTAMHHAKHDIRVLKNNKMPVPRKIVCTMILAYCLGYGRQEVRDEETYQDAGMIGGLGLKYLARRHLGMAMETWQEVKDHPEKIPEYNAKDSVATYLLWEKWQNQIPDFFWKIDMPLLHTIMAMEDRGISLDPKYLSNFNDYLGAELAKIELPLNAFSPKQVGDYIYGTLGIEPWKFTETGQPSTDADVLEMIDDPVVAKILQYKKLYKERGTYIQNYVEGLSPEGRIHPEFKQCRTATGRLACARPNLQNVPREGSEMRALFVAPPGKLLVRVDWDKIEWRLIAAITQDPAMLKVFREGRNVHQESANIFGLSYEGGKKVNYLMSYGGQAWKISQEFHIPLDRAKAGLALYFETYPGVKGYMVDTEKAALETKKVSMWTGRTRRMDALFAEDWRVRQQGIREAINTPIQGGAGEIVKTAMNELHHKHQAPMLLQVHDELLFEVDEKDAKEYANWLKEYIPTITTINGMAFPVAVGIGRNWLEAMGNEV